MGRKPRGACDTKVLRNCRYCMKSAASANRLAAVGAVASTNSITEPEVLEASMRAVVASSPTTSSPISLATWGAPSIQALTNSWPRPKPRKAAAPLT